MVPDHGRTGGIDWLEHTGGSLTKRERRGMVSAILKGQVSGLAGRLALSLGRRPPGPMELPVRPDSRLARDAEEAAADQPPAILGHAYRTWAFGRALVAVDGEAIDEELFYVGSLLHDAGLVGTMPGEDFTLRSGLIAAPIVDRHRGGDAARSVQDTISAHCTPGATLDVDGPEAFYVQAGATLDLGGLRLNHLSADLVDAVLADHSREGVVADISARIRAEAAAVPDGRFAVLRRTGFLAAVRIAPLPK